MKLRSIFSAAAALAAVAALLPAAVAKCPKEAGNCPQNKPCCGADGYCSASAKSCRPGVCNPKFSFSPSSCMKKPACQDAFYTFGNKTRFVMLDKWNGTGEEGDFIVEYAPMQVSVNKENQLDIKMSRLDPKSNNGTGSTITLMRWLSYGSVTVRMKSGVAPGLVVSAILINQEGDEQDFELTGGHPGGRVAEGNYYYDGILEYNVNKRESPEYPLTEKFNDYTLSWLPDRMDWSINGNTYYTKLRNDTWDPQMRAFRFPYRTMKFQMGMWDAAQGEPSTRAWAGGYIDWKAGEFHTLIESINVTCYRGPNGNDVDTVPVKIEPMAGQAKVTPSANATSSSSSSPSSAASEPASPSSSANGTAGVNNVAAGAKSGNGAAHHGISPALSALLAVGAAAAFAL